MPANDREVYQYFHSHGDEQPEVIALAYAGYAKAKYDWVNHVERRAGTSPSSDEVDRWITDLPDSRLTDLLQDAIDFFDLAARAYMKAELDQAVVSARDDAIVREVRASNEAIAGRIHRTTAFSSTFLSNLFIGIVASAAFSLLVILATLVFARDPSPFALYRSLRSAAPAPSGATPADR